MDEIRTGWEVEWATDIPRDEYGDYIYDAAKLEYRDFETREEAMEFAWQISPKSASGQARLAPFTTGPVNDREYTQEPVWISCIPATHD